MNLSKITMLLLALIFSLLLFSCSSSDPDENILEEPLAKTPKEDPPKDDDTNTVEVDDIYIQTETADLTGTDWKVRTTIEGYSGEGYIIWEGADQFWKNALTIGQVGKIEYQIEIVTPGKYLFAWNSIIGKIAITDPWAEHNDSWLRIQNSDFYTVHGETMVKHYPKGSGKTPNGIAGENGNGFMKIFMNDTENWKEAASTWDNKGFQVFAEFETAGEYTVEISPRSSYHAIDSFKLIYQKE